MNTKVIVPLAAFGLLAVTTAAANFASFPADAPAGARIVDLPALTVRPSSQDLAYFRMHRIIDLPRITVRPEPGDLAPAAVDSMVRTASPPLPPLQASALEAQATAADAPRPPLALR